MADLFKALLLDKEGNPMENRRQSDRRKTDRCYMGAIERRQALPLIQVDAEIEISAKTMAMLSSMPSVVSIDLAERCISWKKHNGQL